MSALTSRGRHSTTKKRRLCHLLLLHCFYFSCILIFFDFLFQCISRVCFSIKFVRPPDAIKKRKRRQKGTSAQSILHKKRSFLAFACYIDFSSSVIARGEVSITNKMEHASSIKQNKIQKSRFHA